MLIKLTDKIENVQFTEIKKYTISIIGGFRVKQTGNFNISLVEKKTSKRIKITERQFRVTTLWNFRRAVIFYEFAITEAGEYELTFQNISDLKLQKSQLIITSWLFPRNIKLEKIEIGIQ